jgi:hypothetical protein
MNSYPLPYVNKSGKLYVPAALPQDRTPSNCQTGSLESAADGTCTVVKGRIPALAGKTTLLIQSGHWSRCWLHDRCYMIWDRTVSCSIQAWGANALPRPVIGSPSLISNSYSGALFPEVKRSGCETNHSPSSRGSECHWILTYKPA